MFVRQPGAVFSFLAKPCELPFVRSCWNFLLSATVISCFLDFSPAPACIPSALTGKPTRAGASRKTMKKLPRPQILIFDVDGVLVDVRGTYWRSALETVRHITGKRVTYAELHRFTGRTRQEFSFTFERWPATKHFRTIITMDDAKRKPHPEGLQKILGERDPSTALYLGDNIDDALAAREASVPFVAIIAPDEHRYRQRAARFRELGACALLPRVTDLFRILK